MVSLAIAGCDNVTLLTKFKWQGPLNGRCFAHKLDWLIRDPNDEDRPEVPNVIHHDFRDALQEIANQQDRIAIFVELCVLLGND